MALEGTLSDFGLADIFQLIGVQNKTGVLTLKNGTASVQVTFKDGRVVNAEGIGAGMEDRLGTVLTRRGMLTEDQLAEVLKLQKETLQQLGHILVSRSYLTADELSQSLRMQAMQIIYRLFRWKEGNYHFDQDSDAVATATVPFAPLSAESILMEGVRMLDEWPLIESRITSGDIIFKKLRPGAGVELVEEEDGYDDSSLPEFLQKERSSGGDDDAVRLTHLEAEVYAKVDGHRSVQEIIESVAAFEFDVAKALYDMAERNLIAEMTMEEFLHATSVQTPKREISPAVVRVLYVILAIWLAGSVATVRWNPLEPWTIPPSTALKADSFKSVSMRLLLERVSLGLEAYRTAQGSYPTDLSALVKQGLLAPDDAKGLPGMRVAYEKKGDSFTLAFSKQ